MKQVHDKDEIIILSFCYISSDNITDIFIKLNNLTKQQTLLKTSVFDSIIM